MKKILLIFLLVFVGAALFFIFGNQSPEDNNQLLAAPSITSTPTNIEVEEEKALGSPTTLSIPTLDVEAEIEHVGMDAKGNMDVPKDDDNVAWYTLGHRIGTQGSAVIAGHFDKRDGSPAVFYNLSSLSAGDEVIVTDDQGNTLTFVVIKSTQYPFNNFPLQEVFNTTDKPRLNLITCEGTWNKSRGTYSNRLVVYTELKT